MLIGWQLCIFTGRAARLGIENRRDHPDTVYVYLPAEEFAVYEARSSAEGPGKRTPEAKVQEPAVEHRPKTSEKVLGTEYRPSEHSPAVQQLRQQKRKVRNFDFDPNTASLEQLCELGFSPAQAQSIENYRSKGGRFWTPDDFARCYVVSDSTFARLRPYIRIPKLDINRADSAAFTTLPGIGTYYAGAICRYRARLGGFASAEQLLEVGKFGLERFEKIAPLLCCSRPVYLDLWNLPADSLARHPALNSYSAAKAIEIYRKNTPSQQWSLEGLAKASIIDEGQRQKLSRCILQSGQQ